MKQLFFAQNLFSVQRAAAFCMPFVNLEIFEKR